MGLWPIWAVPFMRTFITWPRLPIIEEIFLLEKLNINLLVSLCNVYSKHSINIHMPLFQDNKMYFTFKWVILSKLKRKIPRWDIRLEESVCLLYFQLRKQILLIKYTWIKYFLTKSQPSIKVTYVKLRKQPFPVRLFTRRCRLILINQKLANAESKLVMAFHLCNQLISSLSAKLGNKSLKEFKVNVIIVSIGISVWIVHIISALFVLILLRIVCCIWVFPLSIRCPQGKVVS